MIAGPNRQARVPTVGGEPLFRWDWFFGHLDDVAGRIAQHLELTAIAIVAGFAISFVLATIAVRQRRLYPPITLTATAVYTIPSFALFAALVAITGLSVFTAEVPLVLYTIVLF